MKIEEQHIYNSSNQVLGEVQERMNALSSPLEIPIVLFSDVWDSKVIQVISKSSIFNNHVQLMYAYYGSMANRFHSVSDTHNQSVFFAHFVYKLHWYQT